MTGKPTFCKRGHFILSKKDNFLGNYFFYLDDDTLINIHQNLGNIDGGKSFTWKLRGKNRVVENVTVQKISYKKRKSSALEGLRTDFNSVKRKEFLQYLSKDTEYLKKAGFSNVDIMRMKKGRVPLGWQVHHKLPLDDSGTNSFDNLVLIKNEPYHKVVTNYQNSVTKKLKEGESITLLWPIFDGYIYPPKH